MHPRFSIAPVNWTNDDDPSLGGDIPLEVCLTEMREAGFEGCELGNKFPKDKIELAACLRRYNLQLTTDWIGTTFTVDATIKSNVSNFRERVKFLAHFDVKALKVCEVGHAIQQSSAPIFSTSVNFSSQQWKQLLVGLKEIAAIAHDHGMYIAYHHHLGTGIERYDDIVRLMNDTNEDDVTLLPDTGHLYAAKIDPLAIIKQFSSRIRYVHLKDVRAPVMQLAEESQLSFMDAVRAGMFTVPGDGCIDFPSIFSLLKQEQFSGWLVVEAEQDPKKAPPLVYARKARDLLRSHFSC